MEAGETGFVLIHGGGHRAASWAPLVPHLDHPAVALELPGRAATAAELRNLTLEDSIRSVIAGVEATGWRRVTLVGHSLAGLILPEVASRLAETVHHVVFIACAVPPEGRSVSDTIPMGLRLYVRWRLRRGYVAVHPTVARLLFCNGMNPDHTRFVLDQLCAEPQAVFDDKVPPRHWPEGVGRAYVLLTRDRALPPRTQLRQIANLGPCEVVTFDGPHDAFVSHPRELAVLLNRYRPS